MLSKDPSRIWIFMTFREYETGRDAISIGFNSIESYFMSSSFLHALLCSFMLHSKAHRNIALRGLAVLWWESHKRSDWDAGPLAIVSSPLSVSLPFQPHCKRSNKKVSCEINWDVKHFFGFLLKRQNKNLKAKRSPEYYSARQLSWEEQCIKYFSLLCAFVFENMSKRYRFRSTLVWISEAEPGMVDERRSPLDATHDPQMSQRIFLSWSLSLDLKSLRKITS